MKIALCLPVHSDTKAKFTGSVIDLLINADARRHTFNRHMAHGISIIHEAREAIATSAMQHSPDCLLWLDSDQTFPGDTLTRLLAHNLPIVGCHYPRRHSPRITSAAKDMQGNALKPKPSGLEPVSLMPFGVALIKAEVFRKLPRPWFSAEPNGEDGYFCEQAIQAGYQPHVDHALSMEVGHIAETVLRFPS